jgi:hypothetical protein
VSLLSSEAGPPILSPVTPSDNMQVHTPPRFAASGLFHPVASPDLDLNRTYGKDSGQAPLRKTPAVPVDNMSVSRNLKEELTLPR